jgi:hypothetical protein
MYERIVGRSMPLQSVCQLIASICDGESPDLSAISSVVSGSPLGCLARILRNSGQNVSNLDQNTLLCGDSTQERLLTLI